MTTPANPPVKRSDLDTVTVLHAIAAHGFDAYEVLTQHFPPKVVLAAFQREVDADRIEYGVSLTRPWITPEGGLRLINDRRGIHTHDVSCCWQCYANIPVHPVTADDPTCEMRASEAGPCLWAPKETR